MSALIKLKNIDSYTHLLVEYISIVMYIIS